MKLFTRIAIGIVIVIGLCALGAWVAYEAASAYFGPELPPVSKLQHIQLGAPLRIYTADGKLMGQFGSKMRNPLEYNEIPKRIRRAFLAAEDSNFFSHGAVDFSSLIRAGIVLITTGKKKQGGSTITMQLARDLFLSPKKTYTRKIKEILLAQRLEKTLTKKQILALYLNRVYLGHHSFGISAAAYVYYGKKVGALNLSEMATLAGLPKAPSTDNPATNPARAKTRRNYVLGRMHDLGWITDKAYEKALQQPVVAHLHAARPQITAAYPAELVRQKMVAAYGEQVYSSGDRVYTTIHSKDQTAAVAALRAGLIAYTERHRYTGPEDHLSKALTKKLQQSPDAPEVMDALQDYGVVGGLIPAAVINFKPGHLIVQTVNGRVTLKKTAFSWTHLSAKNPLKPGAIVRLLQDGKRWELVAIPKAQGALIALDPNNGAIRAMVGGFDFFANNFNRVTQAHRQLGSGFKPYLYAAALAKGYSPASTFLNAPVVTGRHDALGDMWRPQNDNGKFGGLMRMRTALAESVNLVSIRILRAIGIGYMRKFVPSRFDIPRHRIPKNLTAALGTATITPLQQARGYSVFANGGFLVNPYLIKSIKNQNGKEIFHADPSTACRNCMDTSDSAPLDPDAPLDIPATAASTPMPVLAAKPSTNTGSHAKRTLSRVTDYLIDSMLHSVIRHGTGHAATALGRHDLYGKTGTTNNYTDAWFNGFNPSLMAVAWVGFDQPHSLGRGEFGSKAALPIWMAFMKKALAGKKEIHLPTPPGITSVLIDPKTGDRVSPGTPGAIHEVVQSNNLPPEQQTASPQSQPAHQLY